MSFLPLVRPSQIAFFLLLLTTSLSLSACGHTEAAPPDVPVAVVMQAIHDYGQGHQGTPAPPPAGSLEDATEATYLLHVRSLVEQGDFNAFETIAETNRSERGRFVAGDWKNNSFFNATICLCTTGEATEAEYQLRFDQLKKWGAARPESAAAKIALAKLYDSYAEFARGTGYADTVSDKQWRQYRTRTALAKQTLLEAARLKQRDPHWYLVMQAVAHNEGWKKADARELLDQALAFEPDYFHYYRLYGNYLLPQWYGEPGELQSFAAEVAAKHPEPASSILYFQIMSSLACYCQRQIEELRTADWPKLQLGFANLQRVYGLSDLNANRFADMATVFNDKPAAREAFTHVAKRSPGVWLSEEDFQDARNWANTP